MFGKSNANLQSRISIVDCRLRTFLPSCGIPSEPHLRLDVTLDDARFFDKKSLLLEIRESGSAFPVYNPNDMILKVMSTYLY